MTQAWVDMAATSALAPDAYANIADLQSAVTAIGAVNDAYTTLSGAKSTANCRAFDVAKAAAANKEYPAAR